MNTIRCIFDEDKIVARKILAMDSIFPVIIEKIHDMMYSILFFAIQDSTEDAYYLKVGLVAENRKDALYIEQNPLYSSKILNDPSNVQRFREFTKDYRPENTYSSDLILHRNDIKKVYFKAEAYKYSDSDKNNLEKVNLLVSKDCFVRISLFFNRLFTLSPGAGSIFATKKYKNVQFVTIDHVKYDCSSTDLGSNIVLSHYTCGRGPSIFRFTIIDKKIEGRTLKDPWNATSYNELYGEDFMVLDFIYNDKVLYLIFEERSPITDQYKGTKILIFTEEFYKNTSFIDSEFIYKKESANNDKG